jgi:hypothetical protein
LVFAGTILGGNSFEGDANTPIMEHGKALRLMVDREIDIELIEPDYSFSARLQVCVSNAFFISVSASSSIRCADLNSALQDSQKLKAMAVSLTIRRLRLMMPLHVLHQIVPFTATLESAKKRQWRRTHAGRSLD